MFLALVNLIWFVTVLCPVSFRFLILIALVKHGPAGVMSFGVHFALDRDPV